VDEIVNNEVVSSVKLSLSITLTKLLT